MARDGELEAALTEALRAHGPGVLGYLEGVLGDRDDARDAFQKFAEDLWEWLPSYRGGSLRAACYRIARHAAARFRREAWRRRRERMRTTMASRIAASMLSPESRLATRPKDRLERLPAALEPGERTPLLPPRRRPLSPDAGAPAPSTTRPNTLTPKRLMRKRAAFGETMATRSFSPTPRSSSAAARLRAIEANCA